jgi:Ca2+-binding RTX toxin-like protein
MSRIVAGDFPLTVGQPGAGLGAFTIVSADAGQVTLRYAQANITEHFFGTFTLDGSGSVVGGTLTGYDQFSDLNQKFIVQAANLALPAGPVIGATLSGSAALGVLVGGDDEIFGFVRDDVLLGQAGSDTIIALDGNDIVDGGAGNDDVNGNVGVDIVHGGDGDDTVRGGRDNDTIYGDAGNDPHVNGNIGSDLVFGGVGNDTVFGGQDNDTLHGAAGDDLLSGDLGNDFLFGEGGADRFAFRTGSGFDWAADFNFAEGDRIQLAPGTAYTVTAVSGQVALDLGGGDVLGIVGAPAGSFSASWVVFG